MLYPLSYGGPARCGPDRDCSKDCSRLVSSACPAGARPLRAASLAAALLLAPGASQQARAGPGRAAGDPAAVARAPRRHLLLRARRRAVLAPRRPHRPAGAHPARSSIDGAAVPLVPNIGVDRAARAPGARRTPTTPAGRSGWRAPGAGDVTLGQFFTLWGVRFDGRCLGAACGRLAVTADGADGRRPGGAARCAGAGDVQIRARQRRLSGRLWHSCGHDAHARRGLDPRRRHLARPRCG